MGLPEIMIVTAIVMAKDAAVAADAHTLQQALLPPSAGGSRRRITSQGCQGARVEEAGVREGGKREGQHPHGLQSSGGTTQEALAPVGDSSRATELSAAAAPPVFSGPAALEGESQRTDGVSREVHNVNRLREHKGGWRQEGMDGTWEALG